MLPHRVAPLVPSRVYFAEGPRIVLRAFRLGLPPAHCRHARPATALSAPIRRRSTRRAAPKGSSGVSHRTSFSFLFGSLTWAQHCSRPHAFPANFVAPSAAEIETIMHARPATTLWLPLPLRSRVRLPAYSTTALSQRHARPSHASAPLHTCHVITAPPPHRHYTLAPSQPCPSRPLPRCCVFSPRPSHPASTPLPRPPVRCHACSVKPSPESASPRVVRMSAALATPFCPASTCATPRTLFGTPVSLCAHRTVVSFTAGRAVPFRLHPHMLRILVPVSTHPSQSMYTPAPLARVLPALPPCMPAPDSPPPRTRLIPFFPASSCARLCAPACPSRYTSILGILSTILVVIVILVDGVTTTESPGSLWSPADTSFGIDNRNHLGIAFGLFMAGLSSHAAIFSLARDMTDPREFNTMIDWVLVAATSIYALIGCTGYLMFWKSVCQEHHL
ncbi:hypothetical protein DFH08DRAFT_969382 [Mycena albidolilacea]|uniref:Amino acid transporter transmembrane domain-containing protein n=1 Tax=Mycena albidolilacea TaxID=1033008 RepID=A0AAD7EI97_9AGAR|nr:hypothetical protein DFH08DRAFT_969382 [Mycena albidolilacea]